MKKSDKIKPVVKLAQNKEKQAARQMGQAQHVLQENINRLGELQQYLSEYQGHYRQTGAQGVSVDKLKRFQAFMGNLSTAITQQQQVVANKTNEFENYRQRWLHVRSKSQALEKVREKYQAQEVKLQEQREQQLNDEKSMLLHRARIRASQK